MKYDLDIVCRQNRHQLTKYAVSKGVKSVDVEDVVQDVMLRFCRAYDPSRGCLPKTYLFATMNGQILEYHRKSHLVNRYGNKRPVINSFSAFESDVVDSFMPVNALDEVESDMNTILVIEELTRGLSPNQLKLFRLIQDGVPPMSCAPLMGTEESYVFQTRKKIGLKLRQILDRQNAVPC